mmetsp:Transcript_26816/g.61736  ORF Transcript_26816/g.61736 Transcript_26816/m.61736 type:complete len:82 (+) Transcript_26816:128-373(+)
MLQEKLGVLRLDNWGNVLTTGTGTTAYVPLPGDVDDKRTFSYPIHAEVVKGATFEVLTDPNEVRKDEVQKKTIRVHKNSRH